MAPSVTVIPTHRFCVWSMWSVQLLTYKGNNAERSSMSRTMPSYYTGRALYRAHAEGCAFRGRGHLMGESL